MKYFVTADIHGFYDEFIAALFKTDFDFTNPNHMIIICGDLFDRGNQPHAIIDFILRYKEKIILIDGNHEDLLQKMIARNESTATDYQNGTKQTMDILREEFGILDHDYRVIAKQSKLDDVLFSCIDYYETEHYVFVHAWIPTLEESLEYDSNWRNADIIRWNEARWANPVDMLKNKIFIPNKTIVCGHRHCSYLWNEMYPEKYEKHGLKANYEPYITKEMIGLDACTVNTRKVNIVIIED